MFVSPTMTLLRGLTGQRTTPLSSEHNEWAEKSLSLSSKEEVCVLPCIEKWKKVSTIKHLEKNLYLTHQGTKSQSKVFMKLSPQNIEDINIHNSQTKHQLRLSYLVNMIQEPKSYICYARLRETHNTTPIFSRGSTSYYPDTFRNEFSSASPNILFPDRCRNLTLKSHTRTILNWCQGGHTRVPPLPLPLYAAHYFS